MDTHNTHEHPPLTVLAPKTWTVLARAFHALKHYDRCSISENAHMPLSEFAIMEALYHKGSMNIKTLMAKMLMPLTSGAISIALDRLSTQGYITRSTCPKDRRVRYIMLTPEGHAHMAQLFERHAQALVRVVHEAQLDPEALLQLIQSLKQLGYAAAKLPPP
jgi:MarR family 2-MHQ and catechol resistance regulon transcriptional repressor